MVKKGLECLAYNFGCSRKPNADLQWLQGRRRSLAPGRVAGDFPNKATKDVPDGDWTEIRVIWGGVRFAQGNEAGGTKKWCKMRGYVTL